jgi:hypothetical protein
MSYILTRFAYDAGFRVLTFECIGKDHTRTEFHVRADLALARKYGILAQELPLLCRRLLEQQTDATEMTLTFTDNDMRVFASDRAAVAAAHKHKPPRRPPTNNLGSAWRGPMQK